MGRDRNEGEPPPDGERTDPNSAADRSLDGLAKGAAVLAGISGLGGWAYLLGAFGPVSCPVSTSDGGGQSTPTGEAPTTVAGDAFEGTTAFETTALQTTALETTVLQTPAVDSIGSAATRSCTAGIDYLYGVGGNAPVLFGWAMVLLVLAGVGSASAWTGHQRVTWLTAIACGVVTVLGVFSIGWFFLVPAIALLTAAVARTTAAVRTTTT